MKTKILKYLSVFISYFIVDVTYQMIIGIKLSSRLQKEAGIDDMFVSEVQHPILLLIWFLIMTVAIVKLVVEPAVELKSLKTAGLRGLLLGITAYATLALPNGWSLVDYPITLVCEVILEGVLFAPVASLFTTWWLLKKN